MSGSERTPLRVDFYRTDDGDYTDSFLEFITQNTSQYDSMCRELAGLALKYRRRCKAMEERIVKIVDEVDGLSQQ